jgi:hypothetical protein
VKHGFILPCPRSPTELSLPPDPSDLSAGSGSPGVSDPSTASSVKPRKEWLSRPLRFRSQAFSTSQRFPSKSEFHGPVSCRNRSWAFLLQSLPLTGIAHPSRGHMLPCSHPPACRSAPLATLSPTVSPNAHAFARLPGSPDDYGSPFREPKPTSRSPWVSSGGITSFRQLHLLRSLDPPVSPFAPRRVSPTRRPMLSWTSVPSRAFSSPASDPLPVRLLNSARPSTRRHRDPSSPKIRFGSRVRPISPPEGVKTSSPTTEHVPGPVDPAPTRPEGPTDPFPADPAPAQARRPEHAPSP